MNTPSDPILDVLAKRLSDPTTPAADLPAIAEARNSTASASVYITLAFAAVSALDEVRTLAQAMRESEIAARTDREEWRRYRMERDEKNEKLAAENKKLKKQLAEAKKKSANE